jgi:hypothetical protein
VYNGRLPLPPPGAVLCAAAGSPLATDSNGRREQLPRRLEPGWQHLWSTRLQHQRPAASSTCAVGANTGRECLMPSVNQVSRLLRTSQASGPHQLARTQARTRNRDWAETARWQLHRSPSESRSRPRVHTRPRQLRSPRRPPPRPLRRYWPSQMCHKCSSWPKTQTHHCCPRPVAMCPRLPCHMRPHRRPVLSRALNPIPAPGAFHALLG